MKFDSDTTTVNATTAVQLLNSPLRVKSLLVKARVGNSNLVYFGRSDVVAAGGVELAGGESVTLEFDQATEAMSAFYINGVAGDTSSKVDWMAIYE